MTDCSTNVLKRPAINCRAECGTRRAIVATAATPAAAVAPAIAVAVAPAIAASIAPAIAAATTAAVRCSASTTTCFFVDLMIMIINIDSLCGAVL